MSKIEDTFLNKLELKSVCVYMANGYQERGRLIEYDENVILLYSYSKKRQVIIYKWQVATIASEEEATLDE